MNNLCEWDWRYKIFFNDKILNCVNAFIRKLNADEANVYLFIRDYFMSFYSISQLIDAIEENPSGSAAYIDKAFSHSDDIISTPESLTESIARRISNLEQNEALTQLLNISLKSERHPDYCDFCEKVYGTLWEKMETNITPRHIVAVSHGEMIPQREIEECFKEGLARIVGIRDIENRFGKFSVKDFDTEKKNAAGFAEWWDRDLIGGNRDKLVLYVNRDALNENDFLYTIVHEVYPGHGLFYSKLAHNDSLFDHGAMSLIEGWATYCEWNTLPAKYVEQIKNNAFAFLYNSFNLCGDVLVKKIKENKTKQGYSEEEGIRSATYCTQYIGFIENYYLGALWLELYLSSRNIKPLDFLELLKKKNVGDFFSLW